MKNKTVNLPLDHAYFCPACECLSRNKVCTDGHKPWQTINMRKFLMRLAGRLIALTDGYSVTDVNLITNVHDGRPLKINQQRGFCVTVKL
jgi:hypothetical protein